MLSEVAARVVLSVLSLVVPASVTRVDGGTISYACTSPHSQVQPVVSRVQRDGMVCVGWLNGTPGSSAWHDRAEAGRQVLRLAGPHCAQDSSVGRTWAAQKLNDAIARYFPPEQWEAACDTTWGESAFHLESTSGCCIGPFQMHKIHQHRIMEDDSPGPKCTGPEVCPLWTWDGNVKAASLLWAEQGWRPWVAASRRADAGDFS
jgi:hypothetical protein